MDKMMEKTAAYIDAHRQEMLDLWEELVMIESGSQQKAGVDKVCARLKEEMEKAGVKTRVEEMEKAGNSLIGLWGEGRPEKPLLFLGHMDTVFNEDGVTKERPFTIKDGMAYGPGVLDMKSGLIIGLYAMNSGPSSSSTPATRSPAMSTPPAPSFTWTSAKGRWPPSILRPAIPTTASWWSAKARPTSP